MLDWSLSSISLPARLPATLIPWLGRLTALLMLALLAWLGTNIFWTLSTKVNLPPAMSLETDPTRAAQATISRHMFGELASGEATPAASLDIRLTGVMAPLHPGKSALAFLSVDGKPAVALHEGDEVASGITLNRVMPRQVELLSGGRPMLVSLPQRGKAEAKPVEAGREVDGDAATGSRIRGGKRQP